MDEEGELGSKASNLDFMIQSHESSQASPSLIIEERINNGNPAYGENAFH